MYLHSNLHSLVLVFQTYVLLGKTVSNNPVGWSFAMKTPGNCGWQLSEGRLKNITSITSGGEGFIL